MLTSRRNDDTIRSFHRQLLSEYNPEFGLENYVQYFALKTTISKIEKIIVKEETARQKRAEEESKISSTPVKAEAASEFPSQPPAGEEESNITPRARTDSNTNLTVQKSQSPESVKMTPAARAAASIVIQTLTAELKTLAEERKKLENQYFELVQSSFNSVKEFARKLDQQALLKLKKLRSMTEDELRGCELCEMESVYTALHDVGIYRDLNVAAFSKILEKFLSRCCNQSLELQKKVREADKIVSNSIIAIPSYDTVGAMDTVISIMSIVSKKTYEESRSGLLYAIARDYAKNRKRIIPVTSAVYFQRKFAHLQPVGSFPIKLLRGSTHPYICKTIEKMLQIPKTKHVASKFANGEANVRIDEALRGDDVFIVQPLAGNPRKGISLSDSIMELMLMLQCVKLCSAKRITAVLPYMAYTRHTASVAAIAELMMLNGVQHVVTCDMQRDQVEGMFPNIPVENITAKKEFSRFLAASLKEEGHNFENICFVSPDSDGVGRAKAWADSFMKAAELKTAETFVPLCTAVKRITAGSSQLDVIGNVQGKLCVIVDSVIDEGVNMVEVAKKLKTLGADRIISIATHAVFSGDAPKLLVESDIDEIFVSDSVEQDECLKDSAFAKKLRILPLGPVLAESIQRIHTENSLSTLFEK